MLRTYAFSTPLTHGSGSLAAATAAVIADLEPWRFYEIDGLPTTTLEVIDYLNGRAVSEELGEEPAALQFCRTFDARSADEFRIVRAA